MHEIVLVLLRIKYTGVELDVTVRTRWDPTVSRRAGLGSDIASLGFGSGSKFLVSLGLVTKHHSADHISQLQENRGDWCGGTTWPTRVNVN